jgi:hypothetical protein
VDAATIVALVTAGVSAAVSIGTAAWTRVLQREGANAAADLEFLKAELQQRGDETRRQQVEATARARYRDPLLLATEELQGRLGNIQVNGFLGYLGSDRRDVALQTTLYRFARYFGIVEIIDLDVVVLRLADSDATARTGRLMNQIRSTFASDAHDRPAGSHDPPRFMIWREEQRAMGEACLETAGERRQLVGYATFVQRLQSDAGPWFERLRAELSGGGAEESERFRAARELLGQLATSLRSDDPTLARPIAPTTGTTGRPGRPLPPGGSA